MTKPKKPNSGELAEAIERLRAEVAALDAEHDQAEAKCRDCAHDDALYAKARESESAVRARRNDVDRRLAALVEAREDRLDEELDAECERLECESREAGTAFKKASAQHETDRKATQLKYEADTRATLDRFDAASRKMRAAELAVKDARERRRQRAERGSIAERRRQLSERKQMAESMMTATSRAVAEQGRSELARVESELAALGA